MRDAGQTADGRIQTAGRIGLESVPLCFVSLLYYYKRGDAESDVGDNTAGGRGMICILILREDSQARWSRH